MCVCVSTCGVYVCVAHEHVCQLFSAAPRPSIESKNMRFALLNEHKDLIGNTRAFDGTILFLPRKITDSVCEVPTHTCTHTDGSVTKHLSCDGLHE